MVGVEHAKFYTRFCMARQGRGSVIKALRTRPFGVTGVEVNMLIWAFVNETAKGFLQSELLETYLDN
jgi:hypothetical protein